MKSTVSLSAFASGLHERGNIDAYRNDLHPEALGKERA
jgi:hypothetical protein